jgi:hypothetical protein
LLTGVVIPCPFVHERLQDERCGHLVNYMAVLLAGVAGLIQNLVGLAGGQPLVPQVDRQASQVAQFRGEGLDFGGLRAQLPGEMHGIADHDARHAKPPRQPGQPAQIISPVVAPLQRHHRLRRQPQLIRHSYPDAAVADVEAEITNSFQLLAPSF